MKITFIEAKTLPEAWFLCIKALGDAVVYGGVQAPTDGVHSYVITRGSFVGKRRLEFDFVCIKVEYPGSRPLVPDTPQGVPQPATQEFVDGYMRYLMVNQRLQSEEYTYGQDIEDQIGEVVRMYKEDGYGTNHAFMAVGNKDSIKLGDPQCLRSIDTRILGGKLHFMVLFRSWDLWGGFPVNLAAIQILKEYMASEIGVGDGEIIAYSKGLHLYDHCWELANAVLRKPIIK